MVEPETDSQTISHKGCSLTGLGPLTVRYNWHQKKKARKVTRGAANNPLEDYTTKTIFRGGSDPPSCVYSWRSTFRVNLALKEGTRKLQETEGIALFLCLNPDCITKSGRSYIRPLSADKENPAYQMCLCSHTTAYCTKWHHFSGREDKNITYNKKGIKFSIDGYSA